MTSQLKETVLQLLGEIDNEQVLELIKNDIEYFTSEGVDISDGLNHSQFELLVNLANETDTDYTISEDEFIKSTSKWRTQ